MTTRIFERAIVSAGIVALSALLLPSAAWAHRCGPQELTVGKGSVIVYSIRGYGFVPSYEIVENGDPLVAKIETPVEFDNVNLEFKITGTGDGTTVFKIYWQGPQRQDTCQVNVTVHE
jgi:hypothetical protein